MLRFIILPLSMLAASPLCARTAISNDDSITVSGSASLMSDYRFRGVSQTDEDMAVQGGVTLSHESGIYTGVWASNLSGWGTFGGSNMELDLIAGYTAAALGGTVDAGLVWYMYPGGADETDFAEIYGRLSSATGPLSLTAGIAYAPPQQALGTVFETGAGAQAGLADRPDDKDDNLYLSGEAGWALTGVPVNLTAHIGHSRGNPGLGPNGTSVSPTGEYWDWSLGADFTPAEHLTFAVQWIDTDISAREAAYLQPNFSKGQDGAGSIADSTILFSATAAF
jgi:hypothetical protein